jgi:hypothetical protein
VVLDPRFPHETEYELVQRRGREAEARYRQHDAAIEAARARRKALGLPEPDNGPGYYGVGGHMSASEYAAGGYQITSRARRR